MAIVSLVLGILGLVGVLPLIGSIAAIITGNMAKKEIEANPGLYTNDSLARIGVILGWVGLGLAALGLCIGLGFMLLALFFVVSEETINFLPVLLPFV
jgi:hypothetical protein